MVKVQSGTAKHMEKQWHVRTPAVADAALLQGMQLLLLLPLLMLIWLSCLYFCRVYGYQVMH